MNTLHLFFIVIFIWLLAILPAQAQRVVEKTLNYQSGQKVEFDLPFGQTIQISGWDKNEVALVAKVNINSNKLNDAYLLDVIETSDALTFKSGFDEEKLKGGSAEDCPEGSSYQNYSKNGCACTCSEIFYELKVPKKAEVNLKSISADVEATGMEGPSDIKTISGFIDFTWPKQKDAELELKSVTGELYTDLDFDVLNQKKTPPIVGYKIKGKNGNGGTRLALETISSNIYLRAQ